MVFEPAHLVPAPAGDSAVIYAFALVRYNEVLAYAYDFAKTPAHRAGSQGTVEAEKIFVRLAERYAIPFETVAEVLEAAFRKDCDIPFSGLECIGD